MADWHDWRSVLIHPSQDPNAVDIALREALRARRIGARFHYLTPQQGKRWHAVHRAYAPSSGSVASTTTAYEEAFEQLAAQYAGRKVRIISLGCGAGQKDAWLARALDKVGCRVRYLAVDAGQALVLIASETVKALSPASDVRRLVADFEALPDLRAYLDADSDPQEAQLFLAFGILPNANASALLEQLRNWLGAGDSLLLSTNLYRADDPDLDLAAILPQYDNPPTRRWLSTLFADLDWPIVPSQLQFNIVSNTTPARIEASWVAPEPLDTEIAGETLSIAQGESIALFFSNRFQRVDLDSLLHDHGFSDVSCVETAAAAEGLWRATIS